MGKTEYFPLPQGKKYGMMGQEGEKPMRDFPIFAGEHGVSSLILREIPYRGEAYILLGSAQPKEREAHLGECIEFCRAAGAEKTYADGWEKLEGYPLHSEIYEMQGPVLRNYPQGLETVPVTWETAGPWRQLYNRRMAGVDHARTLERRDEEALAEKDGAYFVRRGQETLGIGWLEDGTLLAMAALQPGAGEQVMRALMTRAAGESLRLEVASTNAPAVRLYERMGFRRTAVLHRWREVGGCHGKVLDKPQKS